MFIYTLKRPGQLQRIISIETFNRIKNNKAKTIVMKQVTIIFIILIASIFTAKAQQYNRSAGIRLGGTSGITYKKFIVDEQAVEFLLSGRNNGIQATAMYVYHTPMEISFNENFYFYYGFGGHVGMEQFDEYEKQIVSRDPDSFFFRNEDYFTMGVDAMAGVEYRLFSVPITFSIDVKPYFNFIGLRYTKADFWDTSITVKYIF